jgi:uroporphyrinogen III methyltransferase/synthase
MGMMDDASTNTPGRVAFVGAGPGAADLLTIRAVECLRAADVIVHDALVPQALIDAINPTAERIPVSREECQRPDPGIATGQVLATLALAGRSVVRLKGGDPTVFARLAEELDPLRQAGIAVEFVPGVTAALAAAAAAGVPLTSREAASSLTLVTGRGADGKLEDVDFRAVAGVPGTLAIYMGVEQAGRWSRELIRAGKPADTPVTIVSRCTWPDQRIASTTLAACAAELDRLGWEPPAVIIVGAAARATPARGPLEGRCVIVTRPAGQEAELAAAVRAAGGDCLCAPVITIGPPASWQPLDAAIRAADTYDWIVFASANGVRSFLARLAAAGLDGRALGTVRLAAIGSATRRQLEAAGYRCDLTPDTFRSEGLAEALADVARRGRFLLVRADKGRDVLRRDLEARGHHVDEVVAYESRPVEALDARLLAAIDRTPAAWLTLTSSSIAESAIRLFGSRLRGWRIASISPVTSAAIRRAGFEPAVEAARATAAGLVDAIVAAETAESANFHRAAGSAGLPRPGSR